MTGRVGAAAAVLGLATIVVFLALYATRTERPPVSPTQTAAIASPSPAPAVTAPPTVAAVTTSPRITATLPAAPRTALPAAATAGTGTITGALGYPSQFIPPLTVYAISVIDQRTFFSVDTPRYPLATGATPPRPSYTITGIEPGTYYVLAYRNDDDPNKDRPGVHSQFVLCGGTANCTDHSLVPVTVRTGETVSGIDVTDWYYPQGTRYPPRPR